MLEMVIERCLIIGHFWGWVSICVVVVFILTRTLNTMVPNRIRWDKDIKRDAKFCGVIEEFSSLRLRMWICLRKRWKYHMAIEYKKFVIMSDENSRGSYMKEQIRCCMVNDARHKTNS